MEFDKLVEMAVVALYLLGSVLYVGGMLGGRSGVKRAGAGFAVVGFALHTVDLVLRLIYLPSTMWVQGGFYLSLLAWVQWLVFYLLWWRLKLEYLALAASPLALVLFLSSLTAQKLKVAMPEALSGVFFGLHIAALFIALTLLAMAFVSGIIFLRQERKIKTKERLAGFSKDLPSLNAFDAVNRLAVVVGFPLYTLGLLTGFIFGQFTWGGFMLSDPKIIVSTCTWMLYAYLFHQRLAVGWRGRKAAKLAMLVFSISILSLLVVNFFVPSVHGFKS